MEIKSEIKLQEKCPHKLADCPIYKQTPVRTKINDDNVFFVQKTLSNPYTLNPTRAILGLVKADIDEETLDASVKSLEEKCKECCKNKKLNYPSCITIDLRLWIAKRR